MAEPAYLNPLVLPVDQITPESHGPADLYLPAGPGPHPVILFVHGGPVPPEMQPTPRHWPMYRAYGALAASRGAIGVVVDHPFRTFADAPASAAVLAATLDAIRADPRVGGSPRRVPEGPPEAPPGGPPEAMPGSSAGERYRPGRPEANAKQPDVYHHAPIVEGRERWWGSPIVNDLTA